MECERLLLAITILNNNNNNRYETTICINFSDIYKVHMQSGDWEDAIVLKFLLLWESDLFYYDILFITKKILKKKQTSGQ